MPRKKFLTYEHKPIVEFGQNISALYSQSKDNQISFPQTFLTPDFEQESNLPNIYSITENGSNGVWSHEKKLTQFYVKATKADIGGVGGHVTVSRRVKAVVLDYVLRHNRWRGNERNSTKYKPIFRSLIATHTGDDICVTGVIDQEAYENHEIVDELMWDAFNIGAQVAKEEGLYGPGQDLKGDSFTGNIKGLGPATVVLPLPFDPNTVEENSSQTVLLATADKTDPGAYNYLTTGAYLDPMYNTGLLIAESLMRNGYIFEIYDLDTKAQALESGVALNNPAAINRAMEKFGKTERIIELSGPEDYYDIAALTMNSLRYVIAKIYTKKEDRKKGQLGVVISAERLHNIKTSKGFTYGGKDDPLMLSLCQGDWPAPGEIVSPIAKIPLVPGDCRGSHYMYVYPTPINDQTSFWSGPIISIITLSINKVTGIIGAISDQFAKGTPWDEFRFHAAQKMRDFRQAQGYRQPGTLPTDEMEYQPGFKTRMERLNKQFLRREV